MKIQLSRIGCAALLLTAAIAGVQRTQAQPNDTLPLDVRLRTVMVQGVLWSSDWGPNPGRDDGPVRPLPVDVVPIIVHNCAPLPCPDYALGTNTLTLGPDGFFTMPIVIPEEFLADASALALKFAVRTNGGGEFTLLSGTVPLTAVPYASVAQSVLGPIPASSLTGQMPTGMLTGIFSSPLTLLNQANVFAGDGAQLANVNATTIGGMSPCGLTCYWKTIGNYILTPDSFLGTRNEQPLNLKVNNETVMRYVPRPGGAPGAALIGGSELNVINAGSGGAVICGGGGVDQAGVARPNVILNDGSAIVGGLGNLIQGRECFIGGGLDNKIGDTNSFLTHYVVIGGGKNNTATNVDLAVIGGGDNNTVTGDASVVAGGEGNRASGLQASVSGGWHNIASGWAGVVAGGYTNVAAGQSAAVGGGYLNITSNLWSTIGGGAHNLNSSDWGTIGGGYGNLVSGGVGATVPPGGEGNSATAAGAFAAGTHATAAHEGAFAFADRQPGNFSTDRNNQFAVRAENGVMIQGTATTLDLRGDGAIRVAGAGVASRGPVFIHRATAGSISGHITTIDHPLANGDPNAILLVTHNYSADTAATRYENNAVGVWYNGSQWTIYHENTSVAMPAGRAFNVMIIKP